eukprot:PhF_6_TR31862/c0_g1_i2/m.47274
MKTTLFCYLLFLKNRKHETRKEKRRIKTRKKKKMQMMKTKKNKPCQSEMSKGMHCERFVEKKRICFGQNKTKQLNKLKESLFQMYLFVCESYSYYVLSVEKKGKKEGEKRKEKKMNKNKKKTQDKTNP